MYNTNLRWVVAVLSLQLYTYTYEIQILLNVNIKREIATYIQQAK